MGTRGVERRAYLVGGLLILSGLIHLAILLVSGGAWLGPLSLRKPATFGLSFGLTLINLVWIASYIDLRDRTRAILVNVFTAACVLETALVSLQAWRGVPSHFNVETDADRMVAQMLAFGGVALVVVIVALTVMAFRSRVDGAASMRLAIRAGLLLLVGAQVTGALMIARGMRLVFAGNAAAAYATGGAFKPIHAVTMHGILVLPVIAWVFSSLSWTEQQRIRAVWLASTAYVALVVAVIATTL
ncbi:MAG: hypothetical protein AB7F99_00205 [Vicinamibacterales bacterium]